MGGRFLNADDVIGTSQTWNAYNLYCYVNNNFVNSSDKSGNFLTSLVMSDALILCGIILLAGLASLAGRVSNVSIDISIPDIPKNYSDTPKKETKKNKRDKDSKTCTVYKLVDSKSKVKYVGKTYDVKARKAAHMKNKEGLELEVIEENLDYYECRGYEQHYIRLYRTLHDYKKEGYIVIK